MRYHLGNMFGNVFESSSNMDKLHIFFSDFPWKTNMRFLSIKKSIKMTFIPKKSDVNPSLALFSASGATSR